MWPSHTRLPHNLHLLQGLSGLDQLLLPQAGEGAAGLPTEQHQQVVRMLTEELERLMSLGTGDWAAALQEIQQQQQQQLLQQQQPRQQGQEQQQAGTVGAAAAPSHGARAGTETACAGDEPAVAAAEGPAQQQQQQKQPEVKQEEGSSPSLRGRAGRKRLLSRTTSNVQGMEGVERS